MVVLQENVRFRTHFQSLATDCSVSVDSCFTRDAVVFYARF